MNFDHKFIWNAFVYFHKVIQSLTVCLIAKQETGLDQIACNEVVFKKLDFEQVNRRCIYCAVQ